MNANTSVAGSAHPHGTSGRAAHRPRAAARPATDRPIPLCHYGDSHLAAAYIVLFWGPIGWCKEHLSSIGTWPAEEFGRQTA